MGWVLLDRRPSAGGKDIELLGIGSVGKGGTDCYHILDNVDSHFDDVFFIEFGNVFDSIAGCDVIHNDNFDEQIRPGNSDSSDYSSSNCTQSYDIDHCR
jgi:hypothetical protein